ncbi:oxidoreductase domain-containing protein [Xylariomycetidae sp. FL2044]|nr:oxidoreductase domain-containing protein [Xylariomycetidae sp. FL2044]
MPRTSLLPDDFLSKPAVGVTAEKVDFTKTPVPECVNLYACVIDNALSREECQTLVAAVEAHGQGDWGRAMINIGAGFEALYENTRKCGRIIWDSQDLATKIWKRVEDLPEVQEIRRLEDRPRVTGLGPMKRKQVWTLTRPNERLRFLKYVGGEYFRPHTDGLYESEDLRERSYFTIHLYLNDSGVPSEDQLNGLTSEEKESAIDNATVGGATTFHGMNLDMNRRYDVAPKAGRILIFQQRDLLHSGDDVVKGVKYTMRSDLMYALESGAQLDSPN